MVARQPSEAGSQGETVLDDPALGQQYEVGLGSLGVGQLNDLECDALCCLTWRVAACIRCANSATCVRSCSSAVVAITASLLGWEPVNMRIGEWSCVWT